MTPISALRHPDRLHKVGRALDAVTFGFEVHTNPAFSYLFTWTFPATQAIGQITICDSQPVPNASGQLGHAVWSAPAFYTPTNSVDPTTQTIQFASTLSWQPGMLATPCSIPASFDEAFRALHPDVDLRFGDGSLIFTVSGGATVNYGSLRAAYSVDPVGPVGADRLKAY